MSQPEQGRTRPRVVLFRADSIDADTRAKKWALSLERLGYDVVVLAPVPPGADTREARLGEAIRVVPVPVPTTERDRLRDELVARRAWRPVRDRRVDKVFRAGWRRWTTWSRGRTELATVRGNLPEVLDYSGAYAPVLLELQPDVLHAHHPFVLPVAVEVAGRLRAQGRTVRMVYDARENYAGIPEGEQGNRRRHGVLVGLEAGAIREFDVVTTVSEPIADALQQRYSLSRRPGVLLNVPVRVPDDPHGRQVRSDLGLGSDVPLLVYSGGMSRSRGIEDLMAALPLLPGVHLALITVPHPHPMTEGLLELAGAARDRVHVLPPVPQDRLIGYLAGADVGVHPMPGGSPNHDMALPNKLFEYLHSGLTLAVSDAREMAAFVRANSLGEVFPSHDPRGLAAAVQRALATRGTQSGADREELARRYSWQGQEAEIAAVYDPLAATGAVRGEPAEPFPSLAVRWPAESEVD